jgi:hypothetical protein
MGELRLPNYQDYSSYFGLPSADPYIRGITELEQGDFEQQALLRRQGQGARRYAGSVEALQPALYERLGLRPTKERRTVGYDEQQGNLRELFSTALQEYQDAGGDTTQMPLANRASDVLRGLGYDPSRPEVLAGIQQFIAGTLSAPPADVQRGYDAFIKAGLLEAPEEQITGYEQVGPSGRSGEDSEIARLFQERSLKALRGEADVDPRLAADLAQEEQDIRERLIQRFGPGYEESTPGQEALSRFQDRKNQILAQSRREELTLAEQLGGERSMREEALEQGYLQRALATAQTPEMGLEQLALASSSYNEPLGRRSRDRQAQAALGLERETDLGRFLLDTGRLGTQREIGLKDIEARLALGELGEQGQFDRFSSRLLLDRDALALDRERSDREERAFQEELRRARKEKKRSFLGIF